jgi:hypothetical protein
MVLAFLLTVFLAACEAAQRRGDAEPPSKRPLYCRQPWETQQDRALRIFKTGSDKYQRGISVVFIRTARL